MKRYPIALLAAVLTVLFTVPAGAETGEAAKEAVARAALDYMDGAHAGDAARMERAVHPELTKATVRDLPTGRQALHKAGASRLIGPPSIRVTRPPASSINKMPAAQSQGCSRSSQNPSKRPAAV